MAAHTTVQNPILKGFHPDPSMIRVGGEYLLATSTFEWYGGVALHRSTDLAHWEPLGTALGAEQGLDLRGMPDSGGIWAPALSHAHGRYWLVTTIVKTKDGPFKDVENILTTAERPEGPWTTPVVLNHSGFDPSLFHADDGRTWLVNLNWDHRHNQFSFGGVLLQELDRDTLTLVGEPEVIYTSDLLQEGSHLIQRDGWYYLILAEGGTGYNHGIRIARSESLTGPYETDPEPLLTSRDDPRAAIAKAGHGQFVTTPSGEEYTVHLGSRPVMGTDGLRCPLGRETFLQRIEWRDGWPRLARGGHSPFTEVDVPEAPPTAAADPDRPFRGPHWLSLRVPVTDAWASFDDDGVTLRGRDSLHSRFDQSLLATRLTSLKTTAAVTIEADPRRFTQAAGLALYYDTAGHHALTLTHDPTMGRVLQVVSTTTAGTHEQPVVPAPDGPLRFSVTVEGLSATFHLIDGDGRTQVGDSVSLDGLSDETGVTLRFAGTMVAVFARDLSDHRMPARFSDFRMEAVDG